MINLLLKKRHYPIYIYFSRFDNNLAVIIATLNIIYWCIRAATSLYWISLAAIVVNGIACYIYTKHNQEQRYKDSFHMAFDFMLVALFLLVYDYARYII